MGDKENEAMGKWRGKDGTTARDNINVIWREEKKTEETNIDSVSLIVKCFPN